MIQRMILLLALGVSACDRDGNDNAVMPATVAPAAIGTGTERMTPTPTVVAKPKDQALLDQMILAGYTPHSDHLHPPGVNKCPLSKGSEAVM